MLYDVIPVYNYKCIYVYKVGALWENILLHETEFHGRAEVLSHRITRLERIIKDFPSSAILGICSLDASVYASFYYHYYSYSYYILL